MASSNELARLALTAAREVTSAIAAHLATKSAKGGKVDGDLLDRYQVAAFDLAHSVAELTAAEEAVAFAERHAGEGKGPALEASLAAWSVAEALINLRARVAMRPAELGIDAKLRARTIGASEDVEFVEEQFSAANIDSIIAKLDARATSRGLTDEQQAYADSFRQFAEKTVAPRAEAIHRQDLLVPKEILNGLKEMGCFGLSIPQQYGGIQPDEKPDNMGMVVVTEELSRASLAAAGSLITRPEILSKAVLKGGTEEQKKHWLPKLASGEAMVAVAVTEPDYGSDVAGIKVTATRATGGWLLNGVKTWCTFAGYANTLMVLARTDPDMSKKHKGLSILIAEKPSFDGHEFSCSQSGAAGNGKMEGKAIPTIGYRGMHSFEVAFEDWFVPDANLVGGEKGLGQGFYLQMEGFAGGRLQTAARALGVMQAAVETASRYAHERKIFGKPEIEFGLTRHKLVRMQAAVHSCRQATYRAARLLDEAGAAGGVSAPREGARREAEGRPSADQGGVDASLVKLLACRTAEWITREAMQIHGGMGYAEEFAVSRYFLDARVLSIFEGAEEVLALRVVARSLVEDALASKAEAAPRGTRPASRDSGGQVA